MYELWFYALVSIPVCGTSITIMLVLIGCSQVVPGFQWGAIQSIISESKAGLEYKRRKVYRLANSWVISSARIMMYYYHPRKLRRILIPLFCSMFL